MRVFDSMGGEAERTKCNFDFYFNIEIIKIILYLIITSSYFMKNILKFRLTIFENRRY